MRETAHNVRGFYLKFIDEEGMPIQFKEDYIFKITFFFKDGNSNN